jgi:hypothetical protein
VVRSPTKPSTRRLSEVTRHLVLPSGIVSTGWPAVEAKCHEWGDEFDAWQSGGGRVILGKRAGGLYAATVGGIGLSIPRQVAKTFLVGRIVFALCVLFPGLRVLWTAHHTATLANTFRSLSGYARRRLVAPYIKTTRRGSGKEAIEFANGSVIYFGARSQGFGRGFDEIDVEVFDEAQILDEKALEDMVAATNQCRHPHGALLFYMGTPPRPTDPSEPFKFRRRKALAVEAAQARGEHAESDALWVECSADPDIGRPGGPALDDRAQWRKANPSYPLRTPLPSMLRLRENLPSDDSWRREGMGVWDDDKTTAPSEIDWDQWAALATTAPPLDGRVAYAVRFSADGARVALAAAVRPLVGVPHVELVRVRDMSAGTGWLVDWLVSRWRGAARITVDGKAGAGALVNSLREAKIPARVLHTPTTDEVIAAHSMIAEAIRSASMSHFSQEPLDSAARNAGRRSIGTAGGWGWKSLSPDVDVTPLDAATLALYAVATGKRGAGRKVGAGRRGVIL